MNYTVLYASLASILVAVGLTNVPMQPANATPDPADICRAFPQACELKVPIRWWWWDDDDCLACLDLSDLLKIPENQSLSISVRHGQDSDTIMIDIPKALSSAMLNNSASGFDPQQQPPMVQSN
jgi:hypothetical protein